MFKKVFVFIVFFQILMPHISFGKKISFEGVELELNKLELSNVGFIVWDQRDLIITKKKDENFLGYLRSLTQIKYSQRTKSGKSIANIICNKVQNSFGSVVKIIHVSPFDNEEEVMKKIVQSGCEKTILIKLNHFMFDGTYRLLYDINIETKLIDSKGLCHFTLPTIKKVKLGLAELYKMKVTQTFKSTFEDILNNGTFRSKLNEIGAENNDLKQVLDCIVTSKGDSILAQVIEIEEFRIKYYMNGNSDGPIRNIKIENVLFVIYKDGTKEVFNKKKSIQRSESYDIIE